MEISILFIFACSLITCILLNISILYALLFGFILFFIYTLKKGFSFKEVSKMCLYSISTIKNILITFIFIGMLTGMWRASGTIVSIICYSIQFIKPSLFILISFLLNCLISFLTGTAFGTAATMGSICMSMSLALHINPIFMGGAILSGAYFGDRCSMVSTSALLVSELTKTDIFKNIKYMIKTSIIPFIIACILYGLLGYLYPSTNGTLLDVYSIFSKEFMIGVLPLVSALAILVFSLCKVNVKITMLVSIIISIFTCYFYQHMNSIEIIKVLIYGYHSSNTNISSLLDGGGILSMIRVGCIVCISSCYSGMFEKNGLLDVLKNKIIIATNKVSPFLITLLVSIMTGMIACNQTLTIMLSDQLCKNIIDDKQKFALFLENSAVVISPLIPWSIAGGVVLSSVNAPTISILFAFYLFFIPLWSLLYYRNSK